MIKNISYIIGCYSKGKGKEVFGFKKVLPLFFALIQILNRESESHFPMEKLLSNGSLSSRNPYAGQMMIFQLLFLSLANGPAIHGSKFEEKKEIGLVFYSAAFLGT